MEIYHSWEELPKNQKFVLAMGFFDGCHRGHEEVFRMAKELAKEQGALPGVFTFWPHPMAVLAPDVHVPLLQNREEKAASMAEAGMAFALFLRPDRKFLEEAPEEFLEKLGQLPGLFGLAAGENFTFGRKAKGNSSLLEDWSRRKHVPVRIARLKAENGKTVSSTAIRQLIQKGQVKEAARLLGRNYTITGDVVHGFRRGHEVLGFPTANLSFTEDRVLPADGVYAAYAVIDGKKYSAITNIGKNPTFEGKERTIETFIFHFDSSIYGKSFTLEWVERIRGEIRFPTPEALVEQIKKDIQVAEKIEGEK